MTSELIARIERATEPDRELDGKIDVALFGGELVWTQANWTGASHPAARRPSKNHVGGFANEYVPLYTASLDAVVALVERELPGWDWGVETTRVEFYSGYVAQQMRIGPEAHGKTPALSLLLAFMRAREGEKNG